MGKDGVKNNEERDALAKKMKEKANKIAMQKWLQSKVLLDLERQQKVERIQKKWERY